jgi:hypothetical protein
MDDVGGQLAHKKPPTRRNMSLYYSAVLSYVCIYSDHTSILSWTRRRKFLLNTGTDLRVLLLGVTFQKKTIFI